MGADALAALLFGRIFDCLGLSTLAIASGVSMLFAPLAFLGGFGTVLVGLVLWGVGMGAQESILRAAVAGMVSPARRGTAYGVLNAGYGVMWFAGSALMGILYDVSLPGLIAFSVLTQLASIPLFLLAGAIRSPGAQNH
jgi:MFS-type transporter involved in bile tolerance (Atg22 family)